MSQRFHIDSALPSAAGAAIAIVQRLVDAGHQALLAGGCVRDLLLGHPPQDYDVATSAPPTRVCELFRPTRRVGAQFGVVLVKKRRRWVEVATFRTDGPYLDGRRPAQVTLSDARHDALRRDFTVNGMFLDPLTMDVVDYVGGRTDLDAHLIRAIGTPSARFSEDFLRLLRAVRFAARLSFPIEPVTLAAICEHAPMLANVAAERVRDEMERMLSHPSRRHAWNTLHDCGLLPYLWHRAHWSPEQIRHVDTFLGRIPSHAPFELALAIILADRNPREIERVARALTLSNEERQTASWLVNHHTDLDNPAGPSLAEFKRLMANPAFYALTMWARARFEDMPDGPQHATALADRIAGTPRDVVQPPPLVTGDDLVERGVPRGPIYKETLDFLYTRQLDELITTRDQALHDLDEWLREHGHAG